MEVLLFDQCSPNSFLLLDKSLSLTTFEINPDTLELEGVEKKVLPMLQGFKGEKNLTTKFVQGERDCFLAVQNIVLHFKKHSKQLQLFKILQDRVIELLFDESRSQLLVLDQRNFSRFEVVSKQEKVSAKQLSKTPNERQIGMALLGHQLFFLNADSNISMTNLKTNKV